uniref:Uncharacterized protein n=1 Tax=Arion vulgaris TaxID=1028688 RepID=A0A0B6ZFF7_9EUPU
MTTNYGQLSTTDGQFQEFTDRTQRFMEASSNLWTISSRYSSRNIQIALSSLWIAPSN